MPRQLNRPQIREPLILFLFIVFIIFALKPPTNTVSKLSPLEKRAAALRRDPQVSNCGSFCPPSDTTTPSPSPQPEPKQTTSVTAGPGETLVTTTETRTTTFVTVIPATSSAVTSTEPDGSVTVTEVYVPPRTTTMVETVTGVRTFATPNPVLQKGEAIRLGGIVWTTVIVGFVSFFVILLAM
ncbi:2473_t:CDS:2 [Paraglomus occultum]|uniref:2473_t:CDS:1 n=1 Tax=Paraglomus occultum TaxID=144539 RepID=A0A9N9C7F1_9GLOM|nr:2473_t:CDS:2 [Paraglomus occultum]